MRRRHFFSLFLLVTAIARCGDETELGQGFSVAAPESHLGASVFLDGERVGELGQLDMHDSWLQAVLKRIYGDSPVFNVVGLNIDLSSRPLKHGRHELRVEKPGHPVAVGSFAYPFAGEQFRVFYVNGSKVEEG